MMPLAIPPAWDPVSDTAKRGLERSLTVPPGRCASEPQFVMFTIRSHRNQQFQAACRTSATHQQHCRASSFRIY